MLVAREHHAADNARSLDLGMVAQQRGPHFDDLDAGCMHRFAHPDLAKTLRMHWSRPSALRNDPNRCELSFTAPRLAG